MSYKTLWVSSWVCERDADCSQQVWSVLGVNLLALTTSQYFLTMSAYTPPSFQHMILCCNVEDPVFPKACIWEDKEHRKDHLSVSKTDLRTTISLWILVQEGMKLSPTAHSRSIKFVLRQNSHSSICPRRSHKGKSIGDELSYGQFVGKSTSVLAEKATAFPLFSCLLQKPHVFLNKNSSVLQANIWKESTCKCISHSYLNMGHKCCIVHAAHSAKNPWQRDQSLE